MSYAILAHQYGGPEVLNLAEVDTPSPGDGEVLISMRAAGLNPGDAKELAGVFTRGGDFPLRLGSEVSGVVSAVGALESGTKRFEVGDEVVAFRVTGGYATDVVAPAASVFLKPPNYDWAEASALLHSGATAFHMLEATRVTAGDVLIVHGASGSVGSMLVQLARQRGATVVGTASPERLDGVRMLGATAVSHGDGLLDRLRDALPAPATAALDASGSDAALDASVALVADHDRIATIANYAHAMTLGIRRLGMDGGPDNGADIKNAAREGLIALAASGLLRVDVAAVFPLTSAAEALSLVVAGKAGGKVVLVPA